MRQAAVLVTVLIAFALGARSAFLAPLNGDIAWFLQLALRWLDGARLYVDVIEPNPPLIIWLTAAAVQVGGLIGLGPVPAVQLFGFSIASASAALCGVLLHRATGSRLAAAMPAVLLLALPSHHLGQREHLLLALTLPYVIASASPGLVSRNAMIAIGAAAAVGIALKPYFLGLFIGVELVRWRETRRMFSAATITIIAVGAAYLAAVAVAAPEYIRFARQTAAFYTHFRAKPLWLMVLAPGIPVALLAAVGWTVRIRRGFAPLRLAAYVSSLALIAAVIVQRKGFPYHGIPAAAFGLLGLALTVAGRVNDQRFRAYVLFGWLVALSLLAMADSRRPADAADVITLTAIMERYRGQPVATLSTTYRPTWPSVFYGGIRWTLPTASLWGPVTGHAMQPAGGPYRERAAMPERERWLLGLTVEALRREPPVAIIVDRRASTPLGRLDVVRYLSGHPDFPAFWRQYTPVDTAGRFVVYERR